MQWRQPPIRQAQSTGGGPPRGFAAGGDFGRQALPRGGRKILLVEDDLDALHTLAFVLRKMGHTVEYAINGYAALDIARRFQPEFVILDIGLPGMNGFELCQRIKADKALAGTRVIALTAYGQEEYRQRSLAAGCELYLVKPQDTAALAGYLAGSA